MEVLNVVRHLVVWLGQCMHIANELVTVSRSTVLVSHLVNGFQQHVWCHV